MTRRADAPTPGPARSKRCAAADPATKCAVPCSSVLELVAGDAIDVDAPARRGLFEWSFCLERDDCVASGLRQRAARIGADEDPIVVDGVVDGKDHRQGSRRDTDPAQAPARQERKSLVPVEHLQASTIDVHHRQSSSRGRFVPRAERPDDDEGHVASQISHVSQNGPMRTLMFSARPYDRAFDSSQPSPPAHFEYLDVRLDDRTVELAAGYEAICVFVNDLAAASTVTRLAALGVRVIALRCAGFNNVDVETANGVGVAVVHVPAYSPEAVAEHTLALILASDRHIHRAHHRVRDGNFSLEGLLGRGSQEH